MEASEAFSDEIWEIMRATVELGVFPSAFKPIRLVLVPKTLKGGNEQANPWKRFRPISLLRVLAKILEKVVLWHWEEAVLPPQVHGYVAKRGTITGIKQMKDWLEADVRRGRPGGRVFSGVLLEDVAGAFDHCKWGKIETAVEQRVGREWVSITKSFPRGRSVRLGNGCGEAARRTRTKGVSQGSSLSPKLYVMDSCGVIKDLEQACREDRDDPLAPRYQMELVLYADDVGVTPREWG